MPATIRDKNLKINTFIEKKKFNLSNTLYLIYYYLYS